MLGWLKKRVGRQSIVVTQPGTLKTHNVEAKFRIAEYGPRSSIGKLSQDRWSDGQERFSLRLRRLPTDHSGELRLLKNGEFVSEFDVSGSSIEFLWQGQFTEGTPFFAIGDAVSIEVGSLTVSAVIEAD